MICIFKQKMLHIHKPLNIYKKKNLILIKYNNCINNITTIKKIILNQIKKIFLNKKQKFFKNY